MVRVIRIPLCTEIIMERHMVQKLVSLLNFCRWSSFKTKLHGHTFLELTKSFDKNF